MTGVSVVVVVDVASLASPVGKDVPSSNSGTVTPVVIAAGLVVVKYVVVTPGKPAVGVDVVV